MTAAVSQGQTPANTPVIGRAGSAPTAPLMLGAAERTGRRTPALRALVAALARRGHHQDSIEVLTPWREDPLSIIPALVANGQILARPAAVSSLAADATSAYAVSPSAIAMIKSPV